MAETTHWNTSATPAARDAAPAVDAKNLYVVYVTGEPTGAWDIRAERAALPA